ncbi:MAG TPA: tRNA lysidine(34) synthetase TilS [Candidatus Sulfotelmatobacter sp.]|nr:tRNA lysidine(34) synthetase TilS [Candidatus Sulfotelmatobacter sp.]
MLNRRDIPFGEDAFAAVMARLGPWEHAPCLAVAVSGGADSLALTLLADGWAKARGGGVTALTVDHALRSASADEAALVGHWLASRGIGHRVLRWDGLKPVNGVQASAREARYGLLRQAAAQMGILHLLLAHHLDDQAETLLQRLTRGSGVDGLAAMSRQTYLPELRLLRPLLDVPHAALTEFLRKAGQEWIEDPSNRSDAYQRVRLRHLLADEGLDARRLASTARSLGRAREALERDAAALAARSAHLHEAGFIRLALGPLTEAADEVALRLLASCCRTVAGDAVYPPRLERLERLLAELRGGLMTRRSFGGCLLSPGKNGLLIFREAERMEGRRDVVGGQSVLWDGRFRLRLGGTGRGQVGALGNAGLQGIRKSLPRLPFSSSIVATLPAIWDAAGVSAVPHLGYNRPEDRDLVCAGVEFSPARPLAGFVHCLV